jgi:LacI family transcriptional regulator
VWSEIREERTAQVKALAEEFCNGDFQGVIYEPMAGKLGDEINPVVLEMFDRKKIPVVLLDSDIVPFPERSHYDVVGVNDIEAGARIAKHLISVGAKNVHFLVCKLFPITFSNRLIGAESILKMAGVKIPKGGNVLYAEADDVNALKRYLKRQKMRPDVFICSNDAIAAVFKRTLETVGLRVPQDVMLTGFADLSIASLMTPTLTTVHQNREEMARAAFERLIARIKNPDLPPCDIFLPSQLIVRDSTKINSRRNKK